jgi:hypothetical protein
MRTPLLRRIPVTVAAVATILALSACADGDPKTSADGSTAAPRRSAGAAQPSGVQPGDVAAYCREAKARAAKTVGDMGVLLTASTPAEVKAGFDAMIATNDALSAVAPAELRDSYRIVGETWRGKREAAERAGWSPEEARRLATDLPNESEEHLLATGKISGYWFNHCE